MKTNGKNTQLSINFGQSKVQGRIECKKVNFRTSDDAKRQALTQKIIRNTKSF